MKKYIIIAALLFVFIVMFSSPNKVNDVKEENKVSKPSPSAYLLEVLASLDMVKNTDPVKEAGKAYANGDKRFYGVYSYAFSVPGIPNNIYDEYIAKYKSKPIKGTSDCISSEEQGELMGRAFRYAEDYNKELVRLINGMKKP